MTSVRSDPKTRTSAAAVASIRPSPPRLRASSRTPAADAAFTAAMTTGSAPDQCTRAGTASSQKSSGPGW